MSAFKDKLDRVYQSGHDQQALQQAYRDWANSYDTDLAAAGYAYFTLAPALVAHYVSDTKSRILDAGVGTGRIGEFLALLGYEAITGIDLSDDMLAVARVRQVYSELRRMDLGQRLHFEDDSFDAVYTFGAFTTGHAPAHGYRELVRVTRPGGYLILALTDHARTTSGYGAMLDTLSDEGAISRIAQTPAFEVFPFDPAEQGHLARVDVYRIS
ncbi:MAG: class I SAM-dependent methyltransferase [Candidatus Competibacteraceae bacterium]|nr:class I SAM-dependent methyltransferase [Candidatus Competibacteraceae bacterium]MCB1805026.1 class I SAM-dependent methyltransferase [Candidatus Competibacteraceae bacterium]MCB1810469.1 class I SAM-dependent methyltransferase [Candidatus Competibacteraceae bacterium]